MMVALAVAGGGALGALLRHFMNNAVMLLVPMNFPLGIMAINIAGSLLMGVFTGVFALGNDPSQALKAFLIVGVLGGFTTFSAFSLDSVMLWQRGEFALSLLYVLSSVVFSILALVLGLWLVRVLSS